MQTTSIWVKETESKSYPEFEGSQDFDVAIVGGGITGLTAGLLLQRSGKRVAILDNAQIAMGESGFTTAHLTQILDTRYHKLISDFGVEKACLAAASHRAAIDLIEKLSTEYSIDCQFEKVPGYLYSETGDDNADFEKEINALAKVNIPAQLVESAPLPFSTKQAIRIDTQAQFSPRKYLLGLADEFTKMGGCIFEHSRVSNVTDGSPCKVQIENGTISAYDVILSANVPVTNWLFLNTKIAAYRSYALCATTQKPVLPGLYWDSLDTYHYIRNYHSDKIGDCLIIGGEDHKTGTTANTDECFARLERYAREHFDITEIECRWSGQIINPVDGLAYIGLNSMAKHVYVSTGYSGNGLTYGTLGGMIIADAISGRENRFAPVYQATRVHAMASIGKFISENVDTPVHFIADRLSNNIAQSVDEIKFNEGALLKCNGETLAAYRDENGELHTCSAVCPHMGCLVQWNAAETSWDCPCHGSRFDKNGKLQNGPAIADLKPCDAVMDEIPAIA